VRQPVSPEYLELVTGWVTKRWGARVNRLERAARGLRNAGAIS
jgi:hypothetical protein